MADLKPFTGELDAPSSLKPFDGKLDGEKAKPASAIRKLGDLGLGFASGAVGATKALADVAGADNKASRVLGEINTGINDYLSPAAKADQQEQGRLMADAKAKGFNLDGIAAGAKAFAVAPAQAIAQGVGSVVPIIAGTALTGGVLPAAAVGAGIGVAMGAGTAKGAIFDEVKKRGIDKGLTEAQATAEADAAQSYGGANTDQIALGGALGAADALTGVSAGATRMARNALGKPIAQAVTNAAEAGVIKRAGMGMLKEMPLEAAQGGQEQVAANVAAQRAGYEAGTWDNVASNATLEALASAGPGAAFGALETNAKQTPPPVVPPAIDQLGGLPPTAPTYTPAPSLTGTNPADLMGSPMGGMTGGGANTDFLTGARDANSSGMGYNPDAGQMTQFPDGSQSFASEVPPVAPVKPSEAMGINPTAGPISAAAALSVDTGITQEIQVNEANAADQAAYEQAIQAQAEQQAEQDTADKPITTGKLAEAQMSEEDKRAILFSNKTVADGGIQYTGTQDGDILNGMGAPFATRLGAQRRVRMEGSDWTVTPVFDGWIVRRKDAMPAENNTPAAGMGGNIATQAEPENQPNQPLAAESIAPVATENVAPAQAPEAETENPVSENPAPVTQPAQPVTGEGAGSSQPKQAAASYQGDEPLIGEYATKREAMDALEGYYVGTVQRSGDKFALYAKSKKPAAPAPAKKDQAKADLDHLFGVPEKRTKALDRIAKGTAYFGNAMRAGEFVAKNGLKDTHQAVKTSATRWDIVAKDSQLKEGTNGTQAPITQQAAQEGSKAPAAADQRDGINDNIRALRAKSFKSIKQGGPRGDVRLSTSGEYVSFDDAVAEARKAVAGGVKAVPFQIHSALDVNIGETDRIIAALSAPVAKPVTPQIAPAAPAAPQSTSPAVQDFIDGKRDDAPTIAEVQAEDEKLKAVLESRRKNGASGQRGEDAANIREAAKPDALSEKEKAAKAKMFNALGKLAALASKNTRMNWTPEEEQQLLPIVIELFDGAMDLGSVTFQKAVRYVREFISANLDKETADAIPFETLQGAYIHTARKFKDQGATPGKEVMSFESLEELEKSGDQADTGTKEPTNEPATNDAGMGGQNPDEVQGAQGQRGAPSQQPDARTDSGDVEAGQPGNVEKPDAANADGSTGLRGAGGNVGAQEGADASGPAGDGRPGAGGKGNTDAGARGGSAGGGRSSRSGKTGARGKTGAVKDPATVSPANTGPGDFVLDDPLKIVGGGQVARFDKNKSSIELRNRLTDEGRAPTREEQAVLAGYTGWGSFGQELFKGNWSRSEPKPGWEARDKWLRENLGQKEWEGLQTSIINAHFTDPPTVLAMWDMVRKMGFTGGRTLEPSIGIGNFYGMMPVDMVGRSQRAGIELDPVTGSMAQMLYPNANIQIKGYEESKTPDNFYDLVIGNWPFFEHGPADRRYNRLSPTLHDYFFLKAIDQTRPGGLVVGITSKGTMDKKGLGARMEMARKAELVAAFRLPTGAFAEYAGTAVVTDIIILRKREAPIGIVANEGWIEVKEHDTKEGTKVFVNEYFHKNPTHVVGEIDFGHGTTSFQPGLIVHRPDNMMEQLKRIAGLVPDGAFKADQTGKQIAYVANHTSDRTNSLIDTPQGLFVVRGEYLAPANEVQKYTLKDEKKTAKREAELKSLVEMRKLYGTLIDAEHKGDPEAARTALKQAYEAFGTEHGQLSNSFGLSYLEKIDDPFYPSIAALEIESTGADGKKVYRPAAILSASTMRGAKSMENPSITDAFVLSRNESVNPSLGRIAELSKSTLEEVKAKLLDTGAGFELPNGDFAPSDIYLSGNVRAKMRDARAALESGNASMGGNIAALEKVIPTDVPYYKIETQMGATWVPASTYSEFVAHMLGLKSTDGIDIGFQAGSWKIDFDSSLNHRAEASSGYGSAFVKFKRLVRAAIANQTINVKRKDSDGNEYIDQEETKEVNGKIADMRMKFGEWLWGNPTRRAELETEYNEVRNAYATPRFDGSFLGFQGMALTLGRGPFQLRQHQVNAIWRAIVTRKSLNAHEVGTGKTFTMGGIAVESRRYGIAKKPMLFAHNANSKSVAAEIQMMYPSAKVLYVDNMSKENVKTRMMQIANDDWDVIVLPHSLIDSIGFKEETLMNMAQEELADLELAATEAAEEDGVSIASDMWDNEEELAKLRSVTAKQLVKQRLKILTTIRKLAQQASKEGSVAFEDLGVDMLLVDEAHEFKKPPIATKMNMKGLQTSTSDRSIAMMFLTKYVRSMNNGANVHLFTGTPITNTMTEVFHMMRYMMQEEMKDASLADWDGWFGSFAREVDDVDLTSTGEYEAVTRLQSFINVPELRRMIGQYMDVVFSDDMPEMKPREINGKTMADKTLTEAERGQLLNGRTENAQDRPYKKVVNESSDMSPEQAHVFSQVQQYANTWKQMSKKDRKAAMTAGAPESPIIHDGIAAKASFDVRLVDGIANAGKEGSTEMAPHESSKAARTIKNLLEIYRGNAKAGQVVFMSMGMAKTVSRREGPVGMKRSVTYPSFSTMQDMIDRLVQAGIPREQIAAVDGGTSKDKRKEIADKMNTGEIRIVFGSTGSLGVGVNMQRNLRAMHHMDAPWMPGDLEQRNGRGHRQGNQWNTVLEYRYITDRLDGKRWQVLARKQRFITDFMKSKGDARVIEGDSGEGDSDILSTFAEAAGDPRVLIREKMKKGLEQLRSRERLHSLAQADAERDMNSAGRDINSYGKQLSDLRASGSVELAGKLLDSQRGDGFRMSIGGKDYAARSEAIDALHKFVADEVRIGDDKVVGTYGGVPLSIEWDKLSPEPTLYLKLGGMTFEGAAASINSLDYDLRAHRDKAESKIIANMERAHQRMNHAKDVANEPFHLQEKLTKTAQQLADLEHDIAMNPVAPPYWLRNGAPIDTEVVRNGKPYTVTGHRWTDDGWFVMAQDEKGDTAIPYLEAMDPQGMPLYEEREFDAPTIAGQNARASAQTKTPKAVDVVVSDGATNLNQTGAPEANTTDVVFSRTKNRPTFSRGAQAQANQSVQKLVDALRANWDNAPEIIVAFDMQDANIPEAVRQEDLKQRSGGAAGTPEGFYYKGKVYLLSSQLATPNDVARVLFHETLGHFGLRSHFGKGLKQILNQIITARKALVDAKIKEYGLRSVNNLDRLAAAEEVLAEMAQTTPEIGFVKRAVAIIRSWLRANVPGFSNMKMTDAEIITNFILPARRFVEGKGGPNGGMKAPASGNIATRAAFGRGTNEAVTNPNDVVGNQGGRSADDSTPGAVYKDNMPPERDGFMRLYHGGSGDTKTGKDFGVVPSGGVFDGFFARPDSASSWGSHGTGHDYFADIPSEKILSAYDLSYEVPYEKTLSAFESVTRVKEGDDGFDVVWAAVIEDNTQKDEDALVDALGADDLGEAGWMAQKMRGQVAKKLGYDAIQMEDEHGDGTYLIVSGVKVTRALSKNESTAPDSGGAMFSRSLGATLTDAANNVRGVKLAAGYEVGDLINGVPGKLHWWHRTVGTQYNLAQRSKPFKRVFDSVQNFIGDVSYFASEAADLAPNILPKLENLKDIGKSPLSADDTKAISAPIFEGTLTWGRDESGKPVKMEVLEAAAAKLTTDQKSQRLLRGNHLTAGVLKMWRGLPIDQYTALIDGKYESDMLKAGVVWTDAELKSLFNLTDKQIPLYREFRAATDKSLTNLAIADMLRFAGKDAEPIRESVLDAKTPKEAADTLAEYLRSLASADGERSDVLMDTADKVIGKGDKAQDLMDRGYAPLSRFGKYTLDVVDENGDRVYFGMFENRFDAAKMNRQMQESFPGATINQGTVSEQAYTLFAGVTPETLELFGDMLGLESTGDGAANEAFQTYLKLAKSSRSAMKRLIQRKGIAGFSEDAGRVLAGFIYSNARQTSSSLHMGEMTQAATDKDAFKNQGELQDAAAKLVDYIKNPQEEAQAFRGLLFAQYIGGSIASAMVNMTQPITMTLPWLAQFGGITSAAKQMASAVKDANKPLTGNARLDAALKRAEEDGTVSPQEVHQLMQQAQGRGTLKSGDGTMAGNALATANNTLSRVMLAWGKPFSWAEQFNRRSTFIAAYRTAVAQGMTDPDAFARRAISETQGIYNKGNKPAWARGAAGSILFTFKQYSISYVEMLQRMSKNGPEGKKAALLALGILFLMSGAGGMPGADDLDDLISGALQTMGYNFDSRTKRQAFFAELFGQGGAQFLERGISGLPGTPIDVSGRMGMGNLIPGTGLFTKKVDHTRDVAELAGPGGDLVKRGFEASAKVLKGEVSGINGAAATIAPKAAQNLHKAFDMVNMGMYRDSKGAKVLDTDATDAVMRGIGFQPNDVKKVQDASFEVQRMIGLNKLTESELSARWALGLFEKDSDKVQAAREDLAEWNRANPESPIRIKFGQVLQRVKKMNESKETRMIKTAPKEIRNAVRAELESSR